MVEGFELDGRPEVLAVQWHPEMLAEQPDPAFAWLVDEARRHADSNRLQVVAGEQQRHQLAFISASSSAITV